jgi:preprotein translocase subunit SecF
MIPNIYAKPYYKYYLVLPALLLVASALMVPGLKYGIDLKGGTRIVIPETTATQDSIEQALAAHSLEDLNVKLTTNPLNQKTGALVEYSGAARLVEAEKLVSTDPARAIELATPFLARNISNATAAEIVGAAKSDFNERVRADLAARLGLATEGVSVQDIGAALGQQFWESSQRAVLVAILLVIAIVFIYFRSVIPSLSVIQSVLFDVFVALAGMAFFNIPLTLPTIAALLMIVGFSVDNNILLTDLIIKRKDGLAADRAHDAFITGLTMTNTLLVVMLIVIAFSSFNQMTTLFQIAAVILFGLVADQFATWATNAVMVLWWMERRQH